MNNYIFTTYDAGYNYETSLCIKSELNREQLEEEYKQLKQTAKDNDKSSFRCNSVVLFTDWNYEISTLEDWFNKRCLS